MSPNPQHINTKQGLEGRGGGVAWVSVGVWGLTQPLLLGGIATYCPGVARERVKLKVLIPAVR